MSGRWNGRAEGGRFVNGQRSLTRRGWAAAISADANAAPCPVTVYDRHVARSGSQTYWARPCGEPATDGGLCAGHAADRRRLT